MNVCWINNTWCTNRWISFLWVHVPTTNLIHRHFEINWDGKHDLSKRRFRQLNPGHCPIFQHVKEIRKQEGRKGMGFLCFPGCLFLSSWLLVLDLHEAAAGIQVSSNHRNYSLDLVMLLLLRPFQSSPHFFFFKSKPRCEEIREALSPASVGNSTQMAQWAALTHVAEGPPDWSFHRTTAPSEGNGQQVYKLTVYFHLSLKLTHGD